MVVRLWRISIPFHYIFCRSLYARLHVPSMPYASRILFCAADFIRDAQHNTTESHLFDTHSISFMLNSDLVCALRMQQIISIHFHFDLFHLNIFFFLLFLFFCCVSYLQLNARHCSEWWWWWWRRYFVRHRCRKRYYADNVLASCLLYFTYLLIYSWIHITQYHFNRP